MCVLGVYVGIPNYIEIEDFKMMRTGGYLLQGTYLSMAANRISYAFDFQGPSYICDTACSSALYAAVQAFNDLNHGIVDYAIVGCAHIFSLPHQAIEFGRLNMLSPEGFARPFCVERDGYARSEAVVAILLQRRNTCRRAYATIVGGGTNADGYKKEGISFPSPEAHYNLMEDIYRDFRLNPDDITYFEAHGTGKEESLV